MINGSKPGVVDRTSSDDESPFRLVLMVLALSTIAMSVGVLLATVVHI